MTDVDAERRRQIVTAAVRYGGIAYAVLLLWTFLIAGFAVQTDRKANEALRVAQAALTKHGGEPGDPTTRGGWPPLGMDKTIALGEALKASGTTAKVTIFCASPQCRHLAADIDDAFQIADWPSDIDTAARMGGGEPGLMIGPPGAKAELLAGELRKLFGNVSVIEMAAPDDLAVMIGKWQRAR